jgi:tetrahydromethanopterin S-methyltransferase subunit C
MTTTPASSQVVRPRPGHYVAAGVLSLGMMSLVLSCYAALRGLLSDHPNAVATFLIGATLASAALVGMVIDVVGIFARDIRMTYATTLAATPLVLTPVSVFAWAVFG